MSAHSPSPALAIMFWECFFFMNKSYFSYLDPSVIWGGISCPAALIPRGVLHVLKAALEMCPWLGAAWC